MSKPVTAKTDKFLNKLWKKKLGYYLAPMMRGAMGRRGWSDRILFAYNFTWFLEIKEDGDEESPSQVDIRKKLESHYFQCIILNSENVDHMLAAIEEKISELKNQVDEYEAIQKQRTQFNIPVVKH